MIFFYFRFDLVLSLNIFSFGLKYVWFGSVFRCKKNYFALFNYGYSRINPLIKCFILLFLSLKHKSLHFDFAHSPKNRENLPIWHKNYLKSFTLNLHFYQNTEKIQQLCCQLLFRIINWISPPKTQKISNSLSSTDCWLNIRSLCKLLRNFRVGNGRFGKWLVNDRVQRLL